MGINIMDLIEEEKAFVEAFEAAGENPHREFTGLMEMHRTSLIFLENVATTGVCMTHSERPKLTERKLNDDEEEGYYRRVDIELPPKSQSSHFRGLLYSSPRCLTERYRLVSDKISRQALLDMVLTNRLDCINCLRENCGKRPPDVLLATVRKRAQEIRFRKNRDM